MIPRGPHFQWYYIQLDYKKKSVTPDPGSGYRDPHPQVADNYSDLFSLSTNIFKSWCLDTHFLHNNSDLVD